MCTSVAIALDYLTLIKHFFVFSPGDRTYGSTYIQSTTDEKLVTKYVNIYVVVYFFLFQLIFIFPLFFGMVMFANEFTNKGKTKIN